MVTNANGVFYATTYHPIQAGSIDGTDITAHDNGVYRALLASSAGLYDPTGDPKAEGDPYCTLFVGRLSANTDERSLGEAMRRFGRVKSLRLVRHIVTGASRGYAFLTFETEKEMHQAYEGAYHLKLDGNALLVDYDRQHLMPGWIPRRLGGGLGGNKESGQLRFGGRDRPFRAPLYSIPHEELQKLGIPLPPEGRYMTRFQIPPPPQRKYGKLDDYHRNYDLDKFYDNQSSSKVGSLASGEQSVEPQQGTEPVELYTTDYRHGGFEPGSIFSKFHKDIHKSGERDRHKRRHEYSRERSDRDRHEGEGRRSKRPWEESREKSLDRMEDSRYEYDRFVRENTHGGHSRDVRYLDDGERDQQKRRKGESRHRNDRDRDTDVDNFESRSLSNKEREYTTSESRPFRVKESSDSHQHRKKIEGSADRSNHDRTKRRRETDVDEKESRSLSRMSDKELESTTSEQLKESHHEDAPDRHRRQKRREDSEERGNISRESKRSRRHRESSISSDRERRHRHRSLKHSQRDEDGKSHHS